MVNNQIENQTQQLLMPLEPEREIPNDDRVPHYAMSFSLEIPLYRFSGARTFARYPVTINAGAGKTAQILLERIDPFVLIPIINLSTEAPPEYIATALPDLDNPEQFDPSKVHSGLSRKFHYTARQNINKLIDIYGRFGVSWFQTLTGRDDAHKICDIVLPINNFDIFPRISRSYRATSRTGIFTDQVINYLQNMAISRVQEFKGISGEQREVAMELLNEMVMGANRAQEFNRAAVSEIINDIKKNHRSAFSFIKEAPEAVYPMDFMVLANLDMKEPEIDRNAPQQQPQAAPVADNSNLIAQLAQSQTQMANLMQIMVANGFNLQGMQLPATPAPQTNVEALIPEESDISEAEIENAGELDNALFGDGKAADDGKPSEFAEQMKKAKEEKKKAREAEKQAQAAQTT